MAMPVGSLSIHAPFMPRPDSGLLILNSSALAEFEFELGAAEAEARPPLLQGVSVGASTPCPTPAPSPLGPASPVLSPVSDPPRREALWGGGGLNPGPVTSPRVFLIMAAMAAARRRRESSSGAPGTCQWWG